MVLKWVILMVLVMGLVLLHTLMLIGTFSLSTSIVFGPVRDPVLK